MGLSEKLTSLPYGAHIKLEVINDKGNSGIWKEMKFGANDAMSQSILETERIKSIHLPLDKMAAFRTQCTIYSDAFF